MKREPELTSLDGSEIRAISDRQPKALHVKRLLHEVGNDASCRVERADCASAIYPPRNGGANKNTHKASKGVMTSETSRLEGTR